jgi:arylsulfatase A-like enzyme
MVNGTIESRKSSGSESQSQAQSQAESYKKGKNGKNGKNGIFSSNQNGKKNTWKASGDPSNLLKIFGMLVGLSLVFFMVQLIMAFSFSLRDDLISVFSHAMALPSSQCWRFFLYGLAQFICYFFFGAFIFIWVCFGREYHETFASFQKYGFFVFLASIALIFTANMWLYPASRFNWFFLPGHGAGPLFLIVVVWFIYQSRFSFYGFFKFFRKYYLGFFGLIAFGMLLSLGLRFYENYFYQAPKISSKPNVIIIGMDDLRTDVLPNMPTVQDFLSKSTNFTQSMTPEARTFVAWTSLLTGLYPKAHGIRFDMVSVENYIPQGSLAQILKDQGYTTFYSTDDDQYANVTKNYGFDHELVGVMDAAEYVLADVNDFPLTNLISQTWLGKWWFNDTYNNRASPFVYSPLNYNREVLSALREIPQRPLFLAIHFNLSHQPFYWSKRPLPFYTDGRAHLPRIYAQAAADMDWQFADFMKGLKAQGLLKNALVIVLSDHGEGLGAPKDRLVSLSTYIKGPHSSSDTIPALSLYSQNISQFNSFFGHGTDVVSDVQWRNALGIRWFGHSQYVGNISQRVSLVDLKSTVLDLLGISSGSNLQDRTKNKSDKSPRLPVDQDGLKQINISSNLNNLNNLNNSDDSVDSLYSGRSLAPMVLWGKPLAKDRVFFTDTGFNPIAIQDLNNVTATDLQMTMKYFMVLPDNGRLVINPINFPELIEQIQRAAVYQDWVLAEYPARLSRQVWVLINMKTRQWTDDFSTPFAKQAPVRELLQKMKLFYGDEVTIPVLQT